MAGEPIVDPDRCFEDAPVAEDSRYDKELKVEGVPFLQ